MEYTTEQRQEHRKRLTDGISPKPTPTQSSDETSTVYAYTRFPNYLFEKFLEHDLNGSEQKLFLYIFRNTFGYGGKYLKFNAEKIAYKTSYGRKTIDRAYVSLRDRNILRFKDDNQKLKYLLINLKTSEWE